MRWTKHDRLAAVASLVLALSLVQGTQAVSSRFVAASRRTPILSTTTNLPALLARADGPPANETQPASGAAGGPPPGAEGGPPPGAGGPPPGAAGGEQGPPPGTKIDPADGGFLGGNPPNASVDLPLTLAFLIMYLSGAVTHISIYRANAKRGHKFLLSDLMFDFCMVRSVTCIFRIIWIFSQLRGIVLAAQIFFNGGASVIFAVNVFLVQRIVRAMHPSFGWSKGFGAVTTGMAISVPLLILVQIGSIIGLFFSVGEEERLNAFEGVLKVGNSYNLVLSTFPFVVIGIACALPGPRPEKFGSGNLRVKTSLVMLVSAMLTTGAVVRTYALFNKRLPGTDDVLYGKPVFYTTQFLVEILVVVMYALFRIDLLFHIPNGSSAPGDYARGRAAAAAAAADGERAALLTRGDIEARLEACDIPYRILTPSYAKGTAPPPPMDAQQPVYAVFFPLPPDAEALAAGEKGGAAVGAAALLPAEAAKVSRRQSVLDALGGRLPGRGSSSPRRGSFSSGIGWDAPYEAYADRKGGGGGGGGGAAPPYEPPSKSYRPDGGYDRGDRPRRSERRSGGGGQRGSDGGGGGRTRSGPARPRRDADSMYQTTVSDRKPPPRQDDRGGRN